MDLRRIKRDTQSARIAAASGSAAIAQAQPSRKKWPIIATTAAIAIGLAIAAYLLGWFSHNHLYTQAELNPKQFTFNSQDDPVAVTSISPDGKYLLLSDLQGLHLKTIATGEAISLPVPPEFCFR